MNKIRSNIGLNLNRNSSNVSTTKEANVNKADVLSSQQAAKKKRTAFENISNASNTVTGNNKENTTEVVKKYRFGLSLGGGSKKVDTVATAKKSSVEQLAKENLEAIAKAKSAGCQAIVKEEKAKLCDATNVAKIATRHSTNGVKHISQSCNSLVFRCEGLELNEAEMKKQMRPCDVQGWENIDTEKDEFNVNDYASYIFKYYREREDKFKVNDYLKNQPYLSKHMRQLLIDWMVEVQQQLEFNHEVLYLSVKLLDLYLSTTKIEKERLQLLGGAAMFIACKFEERIPPVIDDFIYVSDNAYDRSELVKMEIEILKTVDFDLGAPLSYTFLRRYAKCLKADMKFLTLARYVLELALQDYQFAFESDSHKACAALYLALKMTLVSEKEMDNEAKTQLAYDEWNATFIHYTDAFLNDFIDLVPALNNLVKMAPSAKHKTIFRKYSHPVFYQVAKVPSLSDSEVDLLVKKAKSGCVGAK